MNNLKRLCLFSMAMIWSMTMHSQMVFSLDSAVSFALQNNKQLNATRYDVEKSESALKEVRAGWLPQVDATVDFLTYFGYEMEFAMGGEGGMPTFTLEAMTNALTAANNAAAATAAMGGSGKFDMSQYVGGAAYESSIQSSLPAQKIDMGNSSTAKVQLGWMLFNGQVISGLKAAKIGIEMASANVQLTELDVRANVASTYYSALTLEKTLEIVESSYDELKELFDQTEVSVRAGVIEETELDQLRIQLTNLKNTKLAMSRNVQVVYNLLRFHMGLPVNEPIVLESDIDLIVAAMMEERALLQEFDIAMNPTYQIMEKQVELSEQMMKMEKMAYVPNLSAFYAYNAKLLTSGFDMTPNNMGGATLNIPIFSGFMRKNKVNQKRIELLQAEADRDILKDNLLLQESQLRFDYISKFEQFENHKENVEVARRVFDNYERKFENGAASGMELTQANSNYLQAESEYLNSMLSLLEARVSFFKLLNTL